MTTCHLATLQLPLAVRTTVGTRHSRSTGLCDLVRGFGFGFFVSFAAYPVLYDSRTECEGARLRRHFRDRALRRTLDACASRTSVKLTFSWV